MKFFLNYSFALNISKRILREGGQSKVTKEEEDQVEKLLRWW